MHRSSTDVPPSDLAENARKALIPVAFLVVTLLVAGCAASPRPPGPSRCLDSYAALDRAVDRHGAAPSASVRIPGFPYLRVDRFLSSYRDQPMDAAARQTWLARLAALDTHMRSIELASLPDPVRQDLAVGHTEGGDVLKHLERCSLELRRQLLEDPVAFARLQEQADVPSDYITPMRFLGLYPLTALFVRSGIFRWHQQARAVFAMALADLPVDGALRRFGPPPSAADAVEPPTNVARALPRDSLAIPELSSDQVSALFARHAPIWEIDVAGDFDLPGTPVWRNGHPAVDPSQPATFRYLSFTRWQGRALIQLNYLIWFSERPRDTALGLYGGNLDGVVWRVTLADDGAPLLYDSIHACGCYHQLFPGPRLRPRTWTSPYLETPLVPQHAPMPAAGQRLVVRLDSGRHYIQRVYADTDGGTPYGWREYESLYHTPTDDGNSRSLFGRDGLVPGTERRERWLLWPMGIASPGAMRERGRHATAFVGNRHFDDADLIGQLFEPVDG